MTLYFRSFIHTGIKNLDYLQHTSSIVNSGSTSLLDSIIIKGHVQVIVVQEKKKFFALLLKAISGVITKEK